MSSRKCALLAAALLLSTWSDLPAQTITGKIVGRVTDARTGEGLSGASVVLTAEGFKSGVKADSNGTYEIRDIRPGAYKLTVSCVGHVEKVIPDVLLSAGETRSLNVSLQPAPVELNPMTVSASRPQERTIAPPPAVNVVDKEAIQARPALSPVEHLRGVPSVDLINSGLNASNIVVRGFNSAFSGRLLTLTDYRIANLPGLRANAYQRMIPMTDDDLDRIEVLQGPGAALYGPNAAGGIVHMITKSPVAGSGTEGFSGDGELATVARLSSPTGVAVDAAGAVYIADMGNNRIRRVDPDGFILTVAGVGHFGFLGDGGIATQASLNYPTGVAVDASGAVYIADMGNHRIRRVGPNGLITTVVGSGACGFMGDGEPATQASLNYPYGVAVDAKGVLYVADTGNNRIRRVGPNGLITTVAGSGEERFSEDGGLATQAALNSPYSVAVDACGNFYIADLGNERVRRVGSSGLIATVAGQGTFGFAGDGGPAPKAMLNTPCGVAADAHGTLYIADRLNNRIRRAAASSPAPISILMPKAGGDTGNVRMGGRASRPRDRVGQGQKTDTRPSKSGR